MGLFGPSKRELKANLDAAYSERDKALAERDAFVRDLHVWKRDTLDPQIKGLQGIIKAQKIALDEMGILDHADRIQRISRVQEELAQLASALVQQKADLQSELQRQSAEIEKEVGKKKAETAQQFESYKLQYEESYAVLAQRFESKKNELKELNSSVIDLKRTAQLQDLGFFNYDSPAKSSVELGVELEAVRDRIKAMLKDNSAATVIEDFTFNNSKAKGKKFANDMRKLMLRAYNAEAENAIKSVRAGNIEVAIKRLDRTRETAEKLGQFIELSINSSFHKLRIREIELANEHLQTLQQEKELEREHKSQLREQAKAEAEVKRARLAKEAELKRIQREFEDAQREAEQHRIALLEKERDHYVNVAESLEVQADEKTLSTIQAKLEDAQRAIADLDYREANLKAGYVYVLSNIGAFGESVVKIGMTRRLEPHDRVKELSGASVPFVFDTHLMVFSDNARGLEHELHKHFSEVRVNKVNPRKEYFYTTPEAVLEVLKEMEVTVVEFTREADADEYRSSLQLESA